MQRFLDNWSAMLTQPATATALQLHIAPNLAQRLVGLGGGDHYQLTLAKVEEVGGAKVETAWEFVNVTGTAGGQLTVQRMAGAQDWPAGSLISCRWSATLLVQILEQLESQGLALAQAEQHIQELEASLQATRQEVQTIGQSVQQAQQDIELAASGLEVNQQGLAQLTLRVDALEQAPPIGGSGLTDHHGNTLTDQNQSRLSS